MAPKRAKEGLVPVAATHAKINSRMSQDFPILTFPIPTGWCETAAWSFRA